MGRQGARCSLFSHAGKEAIARCAVYAPPTNGSDLANPNVAIRRAGGLDNEELKSVLQEESCMGRTLIGLERLEMQRDRLRAVAALSGMG